jgi:hypothetical protein
MASDNGSVAWVVIEPDPRLPAEAHGSVLIDAQLNAAGWQVQDVKDVILVAGLQGAVVETAMVPDQGWANHLLCARDRGEVVVTIPPGVSQDRIARPGEPASTSDDRGDNRW